MALTQAQFRQLQSFVADAGGFDEFTRQAEKIERSERIERNMRDRNAKWNKKKERNERQ
jgi:hypothetical protein